MSARPFTALDLFSFSEVERAHVFGTIARKRRSGEWEYPIPTSGDFAIMTPDDIIYWVHKAEQPLRRAVRDSGLEEHFRLPSPLNLALPEGFVARDHLAISAAGDLMDHHDLPRSRETLYPAIASLLFDADVCSANLECIVTDDRRSLDFTTSEAPPLTYREGSFETVTEHAGRTLTFVSTACNHSLDCGVLGLRSTQDALDARGIAYHGTYREEAASRRGRIIERRGFRTSDETARIDATAFGLPIPLEAKLETIAGGVRIHLPWRSIHASPLPSSSLGRSNDLPSNLDRGP